MLTDSTINPFDSQETKPYKNDPRIAAMTDLVDSFQRDDIHAYEKVLQNNKALLKDPFIAENIDEVTRNMRTKAVLKLIAPYTRFHLSFVAKQLDISLLEVQDIIGFLVIDKKLRAKIDQAQGIVEIDDDSDIDRVNALARWSSAVASLWPTVLNEGDGFGKEGSIIPGSDGLYQDAYPSYKHTGGFRGTGKSRGSKGRGVPVERLLASKLP